MQSLCCASTHRASVRLTPLAGRTTILLTRTLSATPVLREPNSGKINGHVPSDIGALKASLHVASTAYTATAAAATARPDDAEDTKPAATSGDELPPFAQRHIGPRSIDIQDMLQSLGLVSLEDLVERALPASIRARFATANTVPLSAPAVDEGSMTPTEASVLQRLRAIASENVVKRSFIGMGYANTHVPAVIQRNILENPGWVTPYTPYQAELSQGRLESLLNFQTVVTELTGLPIANASMLDEGTAAAEAMMLCYSATRRSRKRFFIDQAVHPQTLACVATRAEGVGIEVVVGDVSSADLSEIGGSLCGVLVQVRSILLFVCWQRSSLAFLHSIQTPTAECSTTSASQPMSTNWVPSLSVPRICSLSLSCSRQASLVPTLPLATPSGSASRSDLVVHMPRSSPVQKPTNVAFRAAWSVCHATRWATGRIDWRCRRASNTSDERRPPATSALLRHCWPTWLPCMLSTMARRYRRPFVPWRQSGLVGALMSQLLCV